MAQQGIQLDRDNFCCLICLDLLRDPVTIPCGHSYCMRCIKDCWDEEDQKKKKKPHSCPQCRQTFTPRPRLAKNTMLALLVEKLWQTGPQAPQAPPPGPQAPPPGPQVHPNGPGDVTCDVCTGRKLKAVKSCQMCRASYCDLHLQPHYKSSRFKKHKLVPPTPPTTTTKNICSRHGEVLTIFCRTDQQCICRLCSRGEHKHHVTVSVEAARAEKEKELSASRQKIQQMIEDKQKEMVMLQQKVEAINCSADKAVEHSEKVFREVVHSIRRKSSDAKEKIRNQQKVEIERAEELKRNMEQQIDEMVQPFRSGG